MTTATNETTRVVDEKTGEILEPKEALDKGKIVFNFDEIAREIFDKRISAKDDLSDWSGFKTETGEADVNGAWACFVQDVWDAKYTYAKLDETEKFEAFKAGYDNYFYKSRETIDSPDGIASMQVEYNFQAIEQFIQMYDAHLEKIKETQEKAEAFIDPELQKIIKDRDYKKLSEHLKNGIGNYLQSDTFKNYLRFVGQFHKYSARNVRLILAQNPHASHVASFNKWKQLENPVKKGGKATYIYAPNPIIQKDENGQKMRDEKGEFITEMHYKLTPVFDASQTVHPENLPRQVYELENDLSDSERFTKLYQALSDQTDFPIIIEAIDGNANGFYRPSDNTIHLQEGMGQEMTLRVLVHEMTHAKLHTDSHARFGDETYRKQEFEAESVAYIVCTHLGIDTSSYSFGYLSSWTNQGEDLKQFETSLDTITSQAQKMINNLDKTLEKVYGVTQMQNKFEERLQAAQEKNRETISSKSKNTVPQASDTSKQTDPKVSRPQMNQ